MNAHKLIDNLSNAVHHIGHITYKAAHVLAHHESIQKIKLDLCHHCMHHDRGICTKDGLFLSWKTYFDHEKCPADQWPSLEELRQLATNKKYEISD